MWRRLVAFVGHAPGLWLVYGESLPASMKRANVVAVAVTLLAMVAAAIVAPHGRAIMAAVAAWLVGHGLWGAYLFVRLPPPAT